MENQTGKDILRDNLPGTGRVTLQVYTGRQSGYRQPSGFSESHIKIKNQREWRRLWAEIQKLVDRREWTDDYVDRAQHVGALPLASGQG
jgi:hypothetical protein